MLLLMLLLMLPLKPSHSYASIFPLPAAPLNFHLHPIFLSSPIIHSTLSTSSNVKCIHNPYLSICPPLFPHISLILSPSTHLYPLSRLSSCLPLPSIPLPPSFSLSSFLSLSLLPSFSPLYFLIITPPLFLSNPPRDL
jgi:hypothetical protein